MTIRRNMITKLVYGTQGGDEKSMLSFLSVLERQDGSRAEVLECFG